MHLCIYIQYTTTMGEAQSLQQLMKSSQNIQYHVSKNTILGQYYLLGVYPVELTTPLSYDVFHDAEEIYRDKKEKSEYLEYNYRIIKEKMAKQQQELFNCCITASSPPPSQNRFIVPPQIYDAMDDNNKKAANVMANKGITASIEYMFTNPNTGKTMDYAAMRELYG